MTSWAVGSEREYKKCHGAAIQGEEIRAFKTSPPLPAPRSKARRNEATLD